MPDDQAVESNDSQVETPTASPAESTVYDSEDTTEPEVRHSEGEGESKPEQTEKRPPRAQRRIQDLTAKLQQKEEVQPQLPPWMNPPEPRLEGEEITVEQLNKYVASQAQSMTRLELQRYQAQMEARQTAIDYQSDIESLVRENPELDPKSDKYDSELDNALQDLFERTNDLKAGVLKTKASDLFKTIKGIRQNERERGSKETTASMAEKYAEQAVAPGSQSSDTGYSDKELKAMLNKDPGKVRRILENQLPRA